jgi:heterodisulfide reductase subunit A-like polyferredoxin
MADLGVANVVARSAFVNQVDQDLCIGCELCLERCQFDALSMDGKMARVDSARCVGCGVCAIACDQDAIRLVRRAVEQILPPPVTEADWRAERATARGIRWDEAM